MNLTTEPWIPIVRNNGTPGMVGLAEVFSQGDEIRDLAVRPHERIALMRLLICVAQAALDGPADFDDWKTCGRRIAPAALNYLKRWQDAFELFGDGQRFLQPDNLQRLTKKPATEDDEGRLVSKLDVALATGNNSTLFDNAGGTERTFTPAQLALMLLTHQCFSPGGTIGVAIWNGKPTEGWKSYPRPAPGYSEHAPCLSGSMLHTFLRGANIAETVYFNLLSKHAVELALGSDKWGQPVWEAMPTSPDDTPKVANATTTYLGRLVPLSRAIWLENDGHFMLRANGLTYPPFPEWREPTSTIVIRKVKDQSERAVLSASLDKALWRELHALVVKTTGKEPGGPLALQNTASDKPFDIWVGGLVADRGKPLDTVESVFHVPATMLVEIGQLTYEAGVRHAERMERRLRLAVSVYHKEVGNNLSRAEMREHRQRILSKATFQYWTDVDRHVNHLLAVAENPALLDNGWHKTDWGQAVWRAALAAFEGACPCGTGRQIRAYALGRQALFAHSTKLEPIEEVES